MIDLRIYDSTDEIADFTFKLLLETAETYKPTAAALSFGSTYEPILQRWNVLYNKKSEHPTLPFFFPADERLVEITDPDSNWGSACSLFINSCGSPADKNRWASDAETFRRHLLKYFGFSRNISDLPVFDLIFLGLGPDGHTASLFPTDCPDEETAEWNNWVLETTAPSPPNKRLTLGPELIAHSKNLVLTVTGSTKADILTRLFNELYSDSQKGILPPTLILNRREELGLDTIILADKPAAKNIEENDDN